MRIILFALLVVINFTAHAQTENATIEKEYKRYNDLMIARDFDKVLDYTHPALFESYPRDQVKQGLEQIFNNPQMKIELGQPKLSEFAAVKQIEGKYYIRFKNIQTTKMRFGFIEDQTGADKDNSVNALKQNLTTQFGENTVSYDAQTGFFTINATSKMLAYSEDKKTWKFVDIGNAQLRPILEKFIPAEFFLN